MALGQGNLAGIARVAFEAQTGEFNRDISVAEAKYRQATQGMSSDAIRLELAQERLRRALAKGPNAYREIANAELNLRRVQDGLRHSTDALDRSQDRANRSMGRFGRGALAGTGLFQGFARSIAFASSAFLGGAGLLYALRSTINAAKEEELVLGQTKTALEQTGLSWGRYGKHIEEVIRVQSKLGFDDEALLKTFGVFIRRTKDVESALRLNALAVDVARGRYIDLEAAQQIVLKASIGQAGALRRLGFDVKTTATATQLLATLTEKYGNAAESASNTATGAQDRFNVSLENAQEVIGRGLLPALTDLLNRGSEYLDQLSESGELQRKVNAGVEAGTELVRGIASALRNVRAVGEPVVDSLGGIENAAKAATLLWVAFKVKAIAGFAATALSSALTSSKMAADAVRAGAAWDYATRPRTMFVGTTGGGVPGGPLPTGRGRGTVRDRINQYGKAPPGAAPRATPGFGALTIAGIVAGILFPGLAGAGGETGGKSATRADDFEKLLRLARAHRLPAETIDTLEERGLITRGQANRLRKAGIIDFNAIEKNRNAPIQGAETKPGSGGAATKPRRTIADIQLDLARAGTTASTSDDLRYHRELRARYQRQADALERRKNLSAKQKETLRSLYGQLASEQSAIDSIISAGEQKIADQRAAAAEKRERQREAAAAKQKRLDDFYGRRERARRVATVRPERESGGVGVKGAGKGAKGSKDGGITEEDVRRMHADFLTSLQGTMNQFGGNLFAPGSLRVSGDAPNPELFSMVTELREQTGLLTSLISSARHPGTRYARTEFSVAFDGPTF